MKITNEIKRVQLTEAELGALSTSMEVFNTLHDNISHGESVICDEDIVISSEEIAHIADALFDIFVSNGDLIIEDPLKNEGKDN